MTEAAASAAANVVIKRKAPIKRRVSNLMRDIPEGLADSIYELLSNDAAHGPQLWQNQPVRNRRTMLPRGEKRQLDQPFAIGILNRGMRIGFIFPGCGTLRCDGTAVGMRR